MGGRQKPLDYLIAVMLLGVALALRFALLTWTGVGGPFIVLFMAVMGSSFFLGVGPGLLAGLVATPIAGFYFLRHGHHTPLQAITQSAVFIFEVVLVSRFAKRLSAAQERFEASEYVKKEVALRFERSNSELKAIQYILKSILEYSPNIVFIKDRDGKFIFISRKFEELVGTTDAKARGKTDYDFFPFDIAEAFHLVDQKVLKSNCPLTIEEVAEIRGRRSIYMTTKFPLVDGDGVTFGICGIAADITEKKVAEETLQRSELELREAQRVAHVGSWSWDLKSDHAKWSEELYRIFGQDPELPPPRHTTDPKTYTAESLDCLRSALGRTIRDGTPYKIELQLVRADGTKRWISACGEAVRDSNGRVIGVRGTAQDITVLRQLEQMKEEWTSVIAHDLRQPIGVIGMCAGVLNRLRADKMANQEKRAIERIQIETFGLSRMVDDLLDASKLEANRLSLLQKWVDPRSAIREAVDRLSHLTSEFKVQYSEYGEILPVFADLTRIEQVLGNLLSNATKYGEKGSEIEIALRRCGDFVEISITNRGKGIPERELPHLFSRFSRSTKTRESGIPGLGLGLYISKGLIEAHGGRIWAESTPGKTTTFHFTLPVRLKRKSESEVLAA